MGQLRFLVGLGLMLGVVSSAFAQSGEPVKPYFLVIVDTSGSMGRGGAGTPPTNTCGQPSSRLNTAKCVLAKLVNSYGDVVFGLSRFKMGCFANGANCITSSSCITSDTDSPDSGEMLVPIEDDNQTQILEYLDFDRASNCVKQSGVCVIDPAGDPEILVNDNNFGTTPLAGSLYMAKRYYEGGDPTFGTSPIAADADSGCRPYYVILLTDGAETCNTPALIPAATALRNTVVNGTSYDVKTFVIGFGVNNPTQQIEDIAAAGGTTQGYYASNEASLSLAFAQIIADSVLVELCNGIDDDCDIKVDEGFQKNVPCDGPDADLCDEGVTICKADGTGVECNDQSGNNQEVCNQQDDDCDIVVDEAPAICPCSISTDEVCDGKDNDCDGKFDEDVPPNPCGVDLGICTTGQEECIEQNSEQPTGTRTQCTGQGPDIEICNAFDDDCDGVTNGLARECYTFPAGCTLGAAGSCEGLCRTGVETCSATATTWSQCFGQVGPSPDICDNQDNDCDGLVDEGNPGGGMSCTASCGVGVTRCDMGTIICDAGQMSAQEICNAFDDDCDGTVDEGLGGDPCDENGTLCSPGVEQCIGGTIMCVGGEMPLPEVCDCEDNDCDGPVDEEDMGALCPPGAMCIGQPHCRCATPCEDGEFPCPVGFECLADPDPFAGFCVPDACFQVACPTIPELHVCEDGVCVEACSRTTCADPLVCRPTDAACVEDNCNGFPDRCTADELCVDGTCEANQCARVDCPDSQFCRGGDCVASCAGVTCPAGQRCRGGACLADACADIGCPAFQVCDPARAECVPSRCPGVFCPSGQACNELTGQCERDLCLAVTCPGEGQVCDEGDCYLPADLVPPDTTPKRYVTAKGGGCGCRVTPGEESSGLAWLLLAAVALVWRRRAMNEK